MVVHQTRSKLNLAIFRLHLRRHLRRPPPHTLGRLCPRDTHQLTEVEEKNQPQDEGKPMTTKAAYRRWLVKQENAAIATERRKAAKVGEEFIKERTRAHTARGLGRQQAAMVQMKRASESVEAQKNINLKSGKKVRRRCRSGGMGRRRRRSSGSYGKQIRERVKQENATPEAIKELKEMKAAKAAATRTEDKEKEDERERQKKEREAAIKLQANLVREVTNPKFVDDSRRFFYEQRVKAAAEKKERSQKLETERKMNETTFKEAQASKRTNMQSYRALALKSREELKSERSSQAAALREAKLKLAETHKLRMQEAYLSRTDKVREVQMDLFLPDSESGDPLSPGGSTVGGSSPTRSPKAMLPAPTGGKSSPSSRQSMKQEAADAE